MNLHQKLILKSEELFNKQPWNILDDDKIFGIFFKDRNEMYFASIMGSGEMEYGVLLMKGWNGYKIFETMMGKDMDKDTYMTAANMLSISLSPVNELHPSFAKYLKSNRYDIRGKAKVPFIMVKDANKKARVPTDNEAELLCFIIEVIIALADKNLLDIKAIRKSDKVKIFEVEKKENDISIEYKYETIPETKIWDITKRIHPELLKDLKKLPKLDRIYNIGLWSGMIAVKDDIPRTMIIHDENNDFVLMGNVMHERNLPDKMFKGLIDTFSGKNMAGQIGIPKEIRTDSRYLYESIKEEMTSLGIKIICYETLPRLEMIRNTFMNFMQKNKYWDSPQFVDSPNY